MLRSRAFTLVELLIAIALGTAIVTVAAAGMRVAAQTITLAQRLERTNELIAIGAMAAFDELDFWDSYDDARGDASRQRLRGSCQPAGALTAAGGRLRLGLPFAPFARASDGYPPVWEPGSPRSVGDGWHDDERLWAVSADNELTWWPGNKAETQESDCRFGHYSILGLSRLPGENPVPIDGGTSGAVGGWQPRNGGGLYGQVDFGGVPPAPAPGQPVRAYRHQVKGWLYDAIHGLGDAIGWYGMMDYLPANTIVCYATRYRPMIGNNFNNSPGDSTDAAGRPIFLIKTFARASTAWQFPDKPWYMLQSFSTNWSPHGMDFLTSYTAYALLPVNDNRGETTATLSAEELAFYGRDFVRMENVDIPVGDWGAATTNQFVEPSYPNAVERSGDAVFNAYVSRTSSTRPVMAMRPAGWSDVSLSVARYLRLCRYSTQLKVSWTDPLTGERADLRFTAMGTTLRGARRQRNLDQ
jgi:hypothetical protein